MDSSDNYTSRVIYFKTVFLSFGKLSLKKLQDLPLVILMKKRQDLPLVILMKKWQDLPLVILGEKYCKTYPL